MIVRLLCAAVALSLLGALAAPASAQADDDRPRGEQLAWSMLDDVVRISEQTRTGSTGEQGFGFVVGMRDHDLIVVTADHVVRDASGEPLGDVYVTFHDDQGTPRPAQLLNLRLPPSHGDLAIVRLPRPETYTPHWPTAATTNDLPQGTRAWRIGKQEHWLPSATPGQFIGLQRAIWLAFDDLDTPPGSSGGPVVTSGGIVGLVVADGGQSGAPDAVLPIGSIEMQLRQWNLPWNLAPPSPPVATPVAPPPPPPGQVPAEAVVFPRPDTPPSSGVTSIESSARNFILSYYARLSENWASVEPLLQDVIADPITFYGHPTSRPDYLMQQSKYFARWPKRTFLPQLDQLAIRCDPVAQTCQVTDRLNYDVEDTPSGRHKIGSEAIFIRLLKSKGSFSIVEQGTGPSH